MNDKLFFGRGNAKLSIAIAVFDLPAGWSCPQANECLCKTNRLTGRVTDGPNTKFRCYAASLECVFTTVRKTRWNNFELLKKAKSLGEMANLIQDSLPKYSNYIRIHSSGDFFNETYFLAWLNVALNNPSVIFYGYTKTLNFLVKYKKYIPSNFRFTASKGGKLDWMVDKYKLKSAEVVFSTEEARRKGLEIDHDDSHAIDSKKSFALLLHGCQPKGSIAAKSLKDLRKQGLGMYGKGTKHNLDIAKSIKIFISVKDNKITTPHKSFKFIPKLNSKKSLIIYPL